MEAGLEHLSRSGGTLAQADLLLVICEPTRKSVLTATRTAALATELGIPGLLAVGNKARTAEDESFLRTALGEAGITVAAVLPFQDTVASADRTGNTTLSDLSPELQAALEDILDAIDNTAAALTELAGRCALHLQVTRIRC